jgi:hypothetical protein
VTQDSWARRGWIRPPQCVMARMRPLGTRSWVWETGAGGNRTYLAGVPRRQPRTRLARSRVGTLLSRTAAAGEVVHEGTPRELVQVDVKSVSLAQQRYCQHTARDGCTRYRVLRFCRHLDLRTSGAFLRTGRDRLPFAGRRVQSDRGIRPLASTKATVSTNMVIRPGQAAMAARRPKSRGKATDSTKGT